ncbi:iron reductase domain protein [Zasmidium cellare ATCC 36951]|uniref:Iron reductase domain protein n=1 Tax=Zasmidium cellare ATCC 36951 TaxID=1080233 RepID=A0A6A6C992_ZASCE|nr:iron reductase domain protein [Zasmidium cellare ATCC 36951]KAF2162006.1 iron reductase domain protein [Zasmidium cellare ATCC 36951]
MSSTAVSVNAAVSQTCPGGEICYSLNIPDETASSGSGDIFFQITAPTTHQWVALGQGSQMAGSNIFVMYASANGQNVTPEHDSSDTAQITVLEGSGVTNGTMTANVRCSNCNSWNGGSMDFRSSNGQWIYAAKSGSPLESDDLNEGLSIHDLHNSFTWDFTAAKGGSDANPFLAAASSNTTTTTSTSGGSSPPSNIRSIMIAHGVLACLVFVILLPVGGILVRLATFTGFIKGHIAIQLLAYAMFVAAVGMGAYMSDMYDVTNTRHPIIGIIVFILIVFQPIFGYLHHRLCKKTGRRNVWSFVHLTIGRVAIVLGIINGGLGLALAGNAPRGAIIAYGVIAGIFGVTYLAVAVFGEVQKARSETVKVEEEVDREKGQQGSGSLDQNV